jgi:phytoene synthase
MSTWSSNWEGVLLDRAQQALEGWVPAGEAPAVAPDLAQAYHRCAEVTSRHSRTFYLASGLLPPAKRMAVRALYAFCRISDEIVDSAEGDQRAKLDAWRRQVLAPAPSSDAIVRAWADTRLRYHIPQLYVEQLLDGVAIDLAPTRYETFADLAEYCYGVACTVGLMAMHIVGFTSMEAMPYAIKLGVALQLTNILRDVAEDCRAGRVYLPREDLDAFAVSENDIAAGRLNERWRALMNFQITRARQFYAQSWPGVAMLHADGRFAIAAASSLYEAILDDILAHRCDVFHRRAHLSALSKARRLPLIWLRSRRLSPPTSRQPSGERHAASL